MSKSLHRVVLADLPYLSATETALTHLDILLPTCSHAFACSLRTGGTTVPQSNKDCELYSEPVKARRFVPIMDSTQDDEEGDLMRNVRSLHPISSQTRWILWQTQYPSTHPQVLPTVLGPQETVKLVTQRAREAVNVQRETVRRALLHQRETQNYNVQSTKYKFDSSNKKHMLDSLKDRGNWTTWMRATSVRLKVSMLMMVLGHRYHR